MDFDYNIWLDSKLGKPVTWTLSASKKSVSRNILESEVKECILYGHIRSTEQTSKGVKIIKEMNLHDPEYELLVVVYLDLPDRFKIISNHLKRRKR
ncbi:MAG: hypothetical protein ACE5KT_05095 [Methanosarcinales archaeon]